MDTDVVAMMDAARSAVALFVKDQDLAPNDLLRDIDHAASSMLMEIARAAALEVRARGTTGLTSVQYAVAAALLDEQHPNCRANLVRLLTKP